MWLINRLSQKGQSLVEITITLGVSVAVIIALTITTIQGLQSSQFSQNQIQATKLAQEGIERIKLIKDENIPVIISGQPYYWYSNSPLIWSASLPAGCDQCKYKFPTNWDSSSCLSNTTTTQPSSCTISNLVGASDKGESLRNGIFYRQILLELTAPNQLKVTSTVSWTDYTGTHQSSLVTYLTNT